VVLATNTSVMSITEIASTSKGRDRIVGTHWWNPPTLLPLVEVVRTEHLSEWVVDLTMALMRKDRQASVLVQKDVPGFVANRLQHALWRECVSIVEKGIADAATVDEAIKGSFGMRLAALAAHGERGHGRPRSHVGDTTGMSSRSWRTLTPRVRYSRRRWPRVSLGFKTGGKGFQEWTPEEMQGSATVFSTIWLEWLRPASSYSSKGGAALGVAPPGEAGNAEIYSRDIEGSRRRADGRRHLRVARWHRESHPPAQHHRSQAQCWPPRGLPAAETSVNTSPGLVAAVINEVKKANPKEIIVAESAAIGCDTFDVLNKSGIGAAAENAGARLVDIKSEKDLISIPIRDARSAIKKMKLPVFSWKRSTLSTCLSSRATRPWCSRARSRTSRASSKT